MPKLGAALDFSQLEARNVVVHNGDRARAGPVKGQLYFNNVGNELYYWDGSIWQSAKSGAGSSGPPSGPAGGTLAGTYPNPTIGLLQVNDTHVAAANKDGVAGTASMRTLGAGAQQAMAGSTTLNNVTAPSANVNLNGRQIVNLAAPTAGTDAATMAYVDGKTPADATTSVKGIVQLAGDLAGTAASPQIAALAVTDAEVAAANKDGATGTPGMRTLGFTGAKAMPGNADLSSIAGNLAAAGPIYANGQKITNLGDPSSSSDAANKFYVDCVATGLDAKQSVRVRDDRRTSRLSASRRSMASRRGRRDAGARQEPDAREQNGIYVGASGGGGAPPMPTPSESWSVRSCSSRKAPRNPTRAGSAPRRGRHDRHDAERVDAVLRRRVGRRRRRSPRRATRSDSALCAAIHVECRASSRCRQHGITNAMLADGAVDLESADVTGTSPIGNGGTGQHHGHVGRGAVSARAGATSARRRMARARRSRLRVPRTVSMRAGSIGG